MASMFYQAQTSAQNVGIKRNATFNNYNCFINNKINIEMFIKFMTLFYWSASYRK